MLVTITKTLNASVKEGAEVRLCTAYATRLIEQGRAIAGQPVKPDEPKAKAKASPKKPEAKKQDTKKNK